MNPARNSSKTTIHIAIITIVVQILAVHCMGQPPIFPQIPSKVISKSSVETIFPSDKERTSFNLQSLKNITTTLPQISSNQVPTRPRICQGSLVIRNDIRKSASKLKGCTVIDGSLSIALVTNQTHPYEAKDYENVTFPELTEITGYLLFFRVQGLTQLSTLFPNLAVIRGRELISNYALIIYEMTHLQRINLPKLTDILRGSVRIESNPNLCHVSTVNWGAICKHEFGAHFIKDNNPRCNNNNRCPDNCRPWYGASNNESSYTIEGDIKKFGADNNDSIYCWSNQICQEACFDQDGMSLPLAPDGGCCSPECAGGCYASNRHDKCIACRNVEQAGLCVKSCAPHLYEFRDRCIYNTTCMEIIEPPPKDDKGCDTGLPDLFFKAYDGKCRSECPTGYEEEETNRHLCKRCDKNKCRKVCTPQQGVEKSFMVTNVNSVRELSGCNVINGSLEISIKGGKNVLNELENAFKELEEIRNYLKITRSYPILTLSFLRSLRYINGSELDRGQYSLTLIDNPNLQELFPFNQSDDKPLKILNGTVFAHLNPKLCPRKIEDLKTYASVKNWDERDVSIHTNGDKEACNTVKLHAELLYTNPKLAQIRFMNYASQMDDPRSLLYYLISYREVPSGTVTMFDGRDGCNSQNDVWVTMEEPPLKTELNAKVEEFQEVLIPVNPATRYGLYIKTYTIMADATGALSDIIYFETSPDTPGIPGPIRFLSTTNDSVIVEWEPPMRPNGIIEYYKINITKISDESIEDYQGLDICHSVDSREKVTEKITKEEISQSRLLADIDTVKSSSSVSDQNDSQNKCPSEPPKGNPQIREEQVKFQDLIIDVIYLKRIRCNSSPDDHRHVKKRSIDHDLNGQDKVSHNFPMKEYSVQIGSRVEQIQDTTNNSQQKQQKLPTSNTQSTGVDRVHRVRFNPILNKTVVMIPTSALGNLKPQASISNLEHFTSYTIEIQACHGKNIFTKKVREAKNYEECGLATMIQVRTDAIPEYDRIVLADINFHEANESVSNLITWKPPEQPNGLILAYRVRYKLKASEHWTEVCINNTAYNRDGGFIIQDIIPGSYLFNVRTVSMYSGIPIWSEDFTYDIPDNSRFSTAVLTIIAIAVLTIVGLAVASVTYYWQKQKHELIYASVNPDYIQYEPDDWEVDKNNLIIESQIGVGAFGMVYKGQLITEKGAFNCAIKTIPITSTGKQRMDFLREASIMKQVDTFHVVKLMGVVSATSPVYVIMEYMENGDLKEFLRAQREIHAKQNKVLVDGIYMIAAQIADGMAYLASKKFVHRDLAARNCMVGENRSVKIGDFGLTRDVYASDYYRRDTQGSRLPVRWMAPESLSDNMYTSASDAFAYGVVVWEIVTFSAYPYQGLSNDEVIRKVTSGYRMPKPPHCPDKLHYIMTRCWRLQSSERPSFEKIVEYLLPETEEKLYPNCFYRKPKANEGGGGDSIAQSISEETNTGTESYPLLSWPASRANGLTNGENHVIKSVSATCADDTNT